MLLARDLRASREAEPDEVVTQGTGQLGFGEEEEIVLRASQDPDRRDHAGLRRQEERLAGLSDAERLDVVREHALEVVRGISPSHADKPPRAPSDAFFTDYCHLISTLFRGKRLFAALLN
jgi:hypothetical protein